MGMKGHREMITKPSRNAGEPFLAYMKRVNEYFESHPPVIKNQRPDLDQDQDRSGSKKNIDLDHGSRSFASNGPDGLNHLIKGKFEELLKQDPLYLLARSWKTHPATLTSATKRMGSEWVKKQIEFVEGKKGLSAPGRYLSKILAGNQF